VNLYSFLRKKHRTLFAGAFFAVVFLSSVLSESTAYAQTTTPPARTVNDYLTLWGNDQSWGTPSKEALKQAAANGVGYFGPKPKEQGGFDDTGTLKKISAVISLSIDQAKFRAWNMVAATYYSVDGLHFNNKSYLRLLDQSFVVRIYQKDAAGNIINQTITPVPVCSFLDCSNNKNESSNGTVADLQRKMRIDWANQGKPSDRIVKYAAGAATFSNVFTSEEDGYTVGPTGDAPVSFAAAAIGGAATATVVPIPGVNWVGGAILGLAANYLVDTGGPILVMRQTAVVDLPVDTALEKGKPAYMDLWYLGSSRMTTSDSSLEPAPFVTGNPRIQFFNIPIEDLSETRSKKFPFFQIGGVYEFTTPASGEEALAQAGEAQADITTTAGNVQTNNNQILPTCSFDSIVGCFARFTYYVVYWPLAWIAGIIGSAFDFFLGYSISDQSYRATIITTGWKLIRDISNIFFILILVYTGLATVFDLKGVSMKKVVPTLIINALIINFSLFGTRLIIDISNITARVFYNTMSVCEGTCQHGADGKITNLSTKTIGGYKPLSTKIVASFNPQRIFKPEILDGGNVNDPSGQNSTSALDREKMLASADYAGFFIIVTLIAAFIMFMLGKMFFGVMFMFVGRVVGLYLSMIFSPFAVVTRGGMPIVGGIKELGWNNWISDLTNYAMLAPIFVFFLYIIYAFMNSDMIKVLNLGKEAGFMGTVLGIVIPMIIIYMLIDSGVGIAKKYAGKAGNMVQNFASKATGMVGGAAVGLATGGTAFLGRNVIGRGLGAIGGKVIGKTQDGKDITRASAWAANADNNWLARRWNNAYNASQTKSWDARNAGVKIGGKEYTVGSTLNSGLGKFGLSMKDQVSAAVGLGQNKALGKDGKPGGNVMINKKRADDLQKELEEKIQMSHLSDEAAANAWQLYKDKKAAQAGQNNWEAEIDKDSAMKTHLTAEKDAKAATKKAEKDVEEAKKGTDNLAISRAERDFEQKKEDEKKAEEKVKEERVFLIKEIREGRHSKDEVTAAAEKTEKDRLDKYGKVKDNKSFTNAMRAEYVEDLKKDSFWMFGGKPENMKGTMAGIFGTLMASMGPAFGIMGGLFAKEMAEGLVDNVTGSRAKAIKAIIDKATKGSGTESPLAKLEARVAEHQEKIVNAVNEALQTAYKASEYDKLEKSEDLKKGLVTSEARLQDEIETLTKNLSALTGKAREDALYNRELKKNTLKELKDAIKDLSQANKNLNDFKEKEKEKEAREAEKNKPK
jgi:hypothetical protein